MNYSSGSNVLQNLQTTQPKLNTGDSVKDQYQTGWWNKITGGDVEKASAISMANVDRSFSAQQAEINRQFQERLSSSAYQRAVADMKKAGLNPALMYKGLDSASTPGGSTASGSRSTPPASSTGQLVGLITGLISAGASLANTATIVGAKTAVKGTQAITPIASKQANDFYKMLKSKGY